MDLELTNKTALITGASQGIGAEIAHVLASEGCRLRLTARSEENLAAVASDLRRQYRAEVDTFAVDITDPSATGCLARWAGEVDIVINNAGSITPGSITEVTLSEWEHSFGAKFFAAVALIHSLYPVLKRRGGGVILNNIGVLAESRDSNQVVGSCVCAALDALTRSVGSVSLDDGIRVLGISPGAVATPLLDKFFQTNGTSHFPGGRAATTIEVAKLFAFLASPHAGYMSGTVVTIDGGLASKSVLTSPK